MTTNKAKKKKGPIRVEVILPVGILCAITYGYFTYYFDKHLKDGIEWAGTQGVGAEVNVSSVKTSFISGSFELNKLEVTNKEKPSHNTVEIGQMKFKFLWDALLRAKFVVEDASILTIQMDTKRARPGKVIPPPPPSDNSMMAKLQNQVIAQAKDRFKDNVLGDVIALAEGVNYQEQIEKLRDQLKTETRINEMLVEVNTKKEYWDGEIKRLSDPSVFEEIQKKYKELEQEKNFVEQVKKVPELVKLADKAKKQIEEVQKSAKNLQGEVQKITNYPNEVQALVKEDIANLQGHFKIPKLDFSDFSSMLFGTDLMNYVVQAKKYQAIAKQYMPEKKKEEEKIIPPQRDVGKTYNFPITKGYPLFWLKNAGISSKSTEGEFAGDFSGTLTNVTTSPKIVGIPTVLDLKGDLKAKNINGVQLKVTLDHTKMKPKQMLEMRVASFPIPEKMLSNSADFTFGLKESKAKVDFSATLYDESLDIRWLNTLNSPNYVVESKNKMIQELVSNVVNKIPVVNLDARAYGTWSNIRWSLKSNLGEDLASGLKLEIGKKVDEAKVKLESFINEKVLAKKTELLTQVNSTKTKYEGELKKILAKGDEQKKKIEEEVQKAQKKATGGATDKLKEQGKKLLKGFKL
ncbi:MAG: TIGR03545 family protein [Bacteriovoracaceae bacterium]